MLSCLESVRIHVQSYKGLCCEERCEEVKEEIGRQSIPRLLFFQEQLTSDGPFSHTHTEGWVHVTMRELPLSTNLLTYPWSSTFSPSAPRKPDTRADSLPWRPS